MQKEIILLGIESSCDDTAAAVTRNQSLLSNIVAGQQAHESYGGVVPELASRAHQQNIIPVIDRSIKEANITKKELSAIAVTCGPGLLGSLLVGVSFAKGLSTSLNIPLIEVNHLQAHVLVHFIQKKEINQVMPQFPFLCLLVSGGNSQIILVKSINKMKVIGQTIDDAAGEAFDKCAKMMGLPYPGGPSIDRLAQKGDSSIFHLNKPKIAGYNYSFSGLKTSFMYLLRDLSKKNNQFVEENTTNLSASLQATIIEILMDKLYKATIFWNIKEVALSGGVSANSGLRKAFKEYAIKYHWKIHIPPYSFTTDNAAMVAISGYFKYLNNHFCSMDIVPFARTKI